MVVGGFEFTVFTKPWKQPLPDLGKWVRGLGFDGVELPIRPGFQVEPDAVSHGLPEASRILADCGLKIGSIAGPTDERTIAACAEAGVPVIRICPEIDKEIGYLATETRLQKGFDAVVPILEKHGVAIGIQNHCHWWVCNAMGIRSLIGRYDPRHVCAVLDAAHCGLDGEEPEMAVDIVWSHLRIVNLKNAFWKRANGPEAEVVEWTTHWTSGRQGLANWPRYAAELKRRGWSGNICLTAEYTDHDSVDRLIVEDIAFAKAIFG